MTLTQHIKRTAAISGLLLRAAAPVCSGIWSGAAHRSGVAEHAVRGADDSASFRHSGADDAAA